MDANELTVAVRAATLADVATIADIYAPHVAHGAVVG